MSCISTHCLHLRQREQRRARLKFWHLDGDVLVEPEPWRASYHGNQLADEQNVADVHRLARVDDIARVFQAGLKAENDCDLAHDDGGGLRSVMSIKRILGRNTMKRWETHRLLDDDDEL